MNKHLTTALTLLALSLLLAIAGCGDGDGTAATAGSVQASAVATHGDGCAGCPQAAICDSEKQVAENATAAHGDCHATAAGCDPAHCDAADAGAAHTADCSGKGDCTGCAQAVQCSAKNADAKPAAAGCPGQTGQPCGGH